MSFNRAQLPEPVAYFEALGKLTGPRSATWKTTSCGFHGGSDSMRINSVTGAWCCMNCGAKGGDVLSHYMQLHGLEFIDAARQLGAWVDGDKPAMQQKATPLPARTALECLAFESNFVAIAAANVAHGVKLSDVDRFRLLTAASRIRRITEACR